MPKTAPTTVPKQEKMNDLIAQIQACRLCVEKPIKTVMPHTPRPVVHVSATAKICIAGQAPSTTVHKTGLPFNDASGNRLRQWMDVSREEFYNTNHIAFAPMGFCFPGQDNKGADLPPRKECAPAWREKLFAHMPNLELILLVGGYAQKWHLGKENHKTLTETVSHWRDYQQRSPILLPTPHPSWRNNGWLKKNEWFEQETVPWLQSKLRGLLQTAEQNEAKQ